VVEVEGLVKDASAWLVSENQASQLHEGSGGEVCRW
jgi:hypothetical protein